MNAMLLTILAASVALLALAFYAEHRADGRKPLTLSSTAMVSLLASPVAISLAAFWQGAMTPSQLLVLSAVALGCTGLLSIAFLAEG